MAISCVDRHNRRVRCSNDYWDTHVVYRHEIMANLRSEVVQTIMYPDAEYSNPKYPDRLLYFSSTGIAGLEPDEMIKVCVTYHDDEGSIITAYPALSYNPGEKLLWRR